jgi:hypothetical protein
MQLKLSRNKNAEDVDVGSVPGVLQAFIIRKKTRATALKGARGPTTPVLHQGFIEKKGEKLSSSFKRRYAVLEEGTLWYFKEQPTTEQFAVWKEAGGGSSPRRTGQARKMSTPKEVSDAKSVVRSF